MSDCPHVVDRHTSIPDRDNKTRTAIYCRHVLDALGWRHPVNGEHCKVCPRTAEATHIQKIIARMLRFRVVHGHTWDGAGKYEHRDDYETSLAKYGERVGDNNAQVALIDAVRHGMNPDRAIKIAKELYADVGA